MASSFFKFAHLDLDAEGTDSTTRLHSSPKNLYWKHKVVVKGGENGYDIEGITDSFFSVRLPGDLAMCLNIGDVVAFIQEEDPRHDVFLRSFDHYSDKTIEEHIKWKEFLADNSLGIYIYGREFLFGLNRLRILGFYFDHDAVRDEIFELNISKKQKRKYRF